MFVSTRKLTDQQEASSNIIDLTADGVSGVSRMVHYLYHGSHADFDIAVDADDWKSAHQLHAFMYALGDKYDLIGLKEKAEINFDSLATEQPQDLLKLIESIPIVYSSTPDSDRNLRLVTLTKTVASPPDLLHENVKAGFQKVLIEVPDFNWDLHQTWIGLHQTWIM